MPTIHYKYGGSTAARTLQCPAWHELAANKPKDHSANDHADRGTLLHDAIEVMLQDDDVQPDDFLGKKLNNYTLNEDDIDQLDMALEAYLDVAEKYDFTLELIEAEVKAGEDIGGTSDIIAANDDTVFIIDHKFGFNPVNPEENSQGLFYAMCAREDDRYAKLFEGRTKLIIGINQPANADKGEDILPIWETDIQRLNEFTEQYFKALDSQDIDAPASGSACTYCPNITTCPVKTGQARAALMLDPNSTDAKELAEAMAMVSDLEAWVREVKKQAHEQAELGLRIDGFKLVAKRATRKWTDEEAVGALIRKNKKIKVDEAYDTKLKSPAALEKVLKKKDIDIEKYVDYIEAVSTGTTLAPNSDKRAEVLSTEAFSAAIAEIS